MSGWTDLAGKVVIVTGGSSGIGAKISQNLHDNHAKVVVCDLNENDQIKEYSDLFVSCDITNQTSVEEMVATVLEKYGRIDALVNNAGVNRPRLLVDFYKKEKKYEATRD